MDTLTKTERFKALNEETGEIHNLVKLGHDYTLVHKNSTKSYKEKKLLEERNLTRRSKNWVACYHDPIKNKSKKLSLTECGAIMKLVPHLRFKGEGMLIKENQPMNLKDIGEIIEKSKPATIKILDKLEQEQIIFKKKEGRI